METKEIQSEWTMPVETRYKGIKYSFNPGQIKEVPDDFDVKNKLRHFKVVKEGSLKKYKETKQKEREENKPYKKELIDLPKIGVKKAEDIISVYPTREKMVEAAKNKGNLPFDEDIDKVLKEHFGGK